MAADPDFRPWDELVPDALGLIFSKLDNGKEVLQAIPLVCKWWCQVVEGPYCWQRIDTRHFFFDALLFVLNEHEIEIEIVKAEQLLRALLPRSLGSLRELCVSLTDDYMLSFIAEHAGYLETLDIGIRKLKESTFEQFATKLGTLTKLVIRSEMSQPMLEAIGKNCKRLVSLSWDDSYVDGMLERGKLSLNEDDCCLWSMPNLKYLSLRNAISITHPCIFNLLSGSPELERVEIGGMKLDSGFVKEKYPNIVTLVLNNLPPSPEDFDAVLEDFLYEIEVYEMYGDGYGTDTEDTTMNDAV